MGYYAGYTTDSLGRRVMGGISYSELSTKGLGVSKKEMASFEIESPKTTALGRLSGDRYDLLVDYLRRKGISLKQNVLYGYCGYSPAIEVKGRRYLLSNNKIYCARSYQ